MATFKGIQHLIQINLDGRTLPDSDTVIFKVVNNATSTVVARETLSISDIESRNSLFNVQATGSENPFTLSFQEQFTEEEVTFDPSEVVYNIFQTIQADDGSETTELAVSFTVTPVINAGSLFFKLSSPVKETDSNIEFNYGDKEANTQYPASEDVTFNIRNTEYGIGISRTIGISFVRDEDRPDNFALIQALKQSVDRQLAVVSGSEANSEINLINDTITESERFLQYGVITDEGQNLIVTNWVDGGNLNQVNEELEPLGSIVLKLYNEATALEEKDIVIFSKLHANDIIIEADLSEVPDEVDLLRLTPNFKKEVEENTISTFNEYQSFNELTLSGSTVQERVIDYFLQRKQEEVALNVDYTDFNNFVKFSSAEERLVNFNYKIGQIETFTSQSASLNSSNASASFKTDRIKAIEEDIRNVKNGFDEYELFLFTDSGSIYENKPFVSSSDNVFASWPKNTPTEEITNGNFSVSSSWFTSGGNTQITNSRARVYKNGIITQSVSLTPNRDFVLKFDVNNNGLPISFVYNGKTIVKETKLASGSNEFRFSTRNLNNSDDNLIISGASYGLNTIFTDIDNLSVQEEFQLLSSTSSLVRDWYTELREIAREYDRRNKDSLVNNTPAYIRDNSQNKDYLLFVDMVGHVFDGIWLYAKELNNLYDWDNNIAEGLSEDLSIVLLEAYGNNLDIGFSEKDVWEYLLGIDENEDELARQVGFSFERRQKETIRRLLVNLPYFLKHKGTARSIKGLVLSYGIPLSTLFIREYGTFQSTEGLQTVFSKDTETKKLYMSGSSKSISTSGSHLNTSNAIEFNAQLLRTGSFTLVSGSKTAGGNGGGFNISTVQSASSLSGSIELTITTGSESFTLSSSVGPIYNGEFWNFIAQRTDSGSYEVRAYQLDRDTGVFDYKLSGSTEFSPTATTSTASIDTTFLTNTDLEFKSFDGYLDEFRVWDTVIAESVFVEHTKFPYSVKLSDPLKIPDKLLVRIDIEKETSKYIAEGDSRLANLVFNPTYPTQVTASGFSVNDFETFVRTDYIESTNVGNEKLGNNKVRFELTQSLEGSILTPNFEDNNSNNLTFTDVSDSYKLIVGFSPTDIINEIILRHFGNNNLLDEFGDPSEQFNDQYIQLRQTVENFFENISSNRKTLFFIEYIRNFDKTLFDNLKNFVPERADFDASIFIEPHLLDRSKAKRLGSGSLEDAFQDVGETGDDTSDLLASFDSFDNTDDELAVVSDESLTGLVQSYVNVDEATTVISSEDADTLLNQSTDIVVIQDGFESQILRNNVWESDGSLFVKNDFGERFRFKVYVYTFEDELEQLEAEIGAYIENNDLKYIDSETGQVKIQEDAGYIELVREWAEKYRLNGTLFLLDYDANPIENSRLVTFEDLPTSLKEDLILSEGTTLTNQVETKAGITYITSEDTVDNGPVVVTTEVTDTTTIVSSPDDDLKLTVE